MAANKPFTAKGQDMRTEPGDTVLRDKSQGGRTPREPTQEAIRLRAYEIWKHRGGGHGREVEDWVQAERDLKSRHPKAHPK